MKKLLKNMSKVFSMFLLLFSVEMYSSEFSEKLKNRFAYAIIAILPEKILTMLNDPEIVSCIDVNARDKSGQTALVFACFFGCQKIVEKLLELKKPDGSLLVDINARGSDNKTAFMIACDGRRLDIVKSLLAHGADTTIFPVPRNVYCPKTLHDLPERTERESIAKKNILSVFDALKPGIIRAKETFLEAFIFEAYEQFLRGNHTELRNLLLVAPDAVQRRISDGTEERKRCVGYRDTLMRSMRSVFKKESIKPLLYFLAEKKYQRNMAEVLVDMIKSGVEDDCPADHPETVDVVKSVHRLPIEDCSSRE